MAIPTLALVGNPNCGKTTLFNALTGSWQRVGNWSGVTVERKTGYFCTDGLKAAVVDLPGTYSLTLVNPDAAQDEQLTAEYLKQGGFSQVLNVVDAEHIERNLYLTLQCLEQNLPVIIALNRLDVLEKQQRGICLETLSQSLGCPVIPVVAKQARGVEALKSALVKMPPIAEWQKVDYGPVIEPILSRLKSFAPRYQLIRWLEGEPIADPAIRSHIAKAMAQILSDTGQQPDVLIASCRYHFIETVLKAARQESKAQTGPKFSDRLDKWACHRFWGFPIFLGVMYALFFFAINIGGAFQEFFELAGDAIFVEGTALLLAKCQAPTWLLLMLSSGLGKGISTVLTFVPVIGAMFLALSFLEDCGYMARAAFVMDRIMRAIGLPGKSFVPMIVGFGCNVPAIMGARTLDSKRDRILTVMMSPFMSCGARLAIFTVFVAAFFPEGGQNIVFLLYLIGIGMAILTGLFLKRTLLRGALTPFILEIPSYQWPHWPSLWYHAWHRLRRFVLNAGKLIIPVCILVGSLNNIDTHGQWMTDNDHQPSLLAVMGKKVVPVFTPMGVEADNWPAAVALFTGVLAKEVVIGTLNSLYAEPATEVIEDDESISEMLASAVMSIPRNLRHLTQAITNPIAAKAPQQSMEAHAYGSMVQCFNGQANAFAYLLFVLLYFPCISATAAMVREVARGWTLFSVFWTTGLAYIVSVMFYQMATYSLHPTQSLFWCAVGVTLGLMTFLGIKLYSKALPRTLPTRVVLTKS